MKTRLADWFRTFPSAPRAMSHQGRLSVPLGSRLWMLLSAMACLGAFCAPSLQAAEKPYRLGVVVADPALNDFASLLTAELSAASDVELMERAEIDKVLAEQTTAGVLSGAVHAGRVLGAEGLIVLDVAGESLSIRLVSVGPGVHLATTHVKWPTKESPLWAKWATTQQQALFAKLRVSRDQAVPLSVVGLRSAVHTPDSASVEAAASTILVDRLTAQPEIFVLERRQLQLLADEKELIDEESSRFWGGRHLLDGVIDRDGRDPERLTIHAELKPPGGGPGLAFETSGSRTNVAEAIDQLCQWVVRSLRPGSEPTQIDSVLEARRYAEEGHWARRWALHKRAESAYESAWWLGLRTVEIAEHRIRIGQMIGGNFAGCSYTRIGSSVRFTGPPNNSAFERYLESATIYDELLGTLGSRDGTITETWFTLGLETLEGLSIWLRHYYFMFEARKGFENPLRTARELALGLSARLTASKAAVSPALRSRLAGVKAQWGGFWHETPEGGLSIHAELLAAGELSLTRKRFLNVADFEEPPDRQGRILGAGRASDRLDPASPCLAGWKWEDRRRWPKVWTGFVDSLCASTDVRTRFEGKYIRCSGQWSSKAYLSDLKDLLGFVEENAETLVVADAEQSLLKDLKEIVEVRRYHLDDDEIRRVVDETWTPFEQRFRPVEQRIRSRQRDQERARSLEIAWAKTGEKPQSRSPVTNRSVLSVPLPNQPYRLAPPSTLVTRQDRSPKARWWGMVPTGTNQMVVPRFWSIPSASRETGDGAFRSIETITERDGRIWAEVREADMLSSFAQKDIPGTLYSIDPATFETRSIRFVDKDAMFEVASARSAAGSSGGEVHRPANTHHAPYNSYSHRIWDFHSGRLYMGLQRMLQRYDAGSGQWEPLPITYEGYGRVMSVGGRLFVTTKDSILEVKDDGGSFALLASTRRRPVQTALDKLETLDWPAIWIDGESRLFAMVHGSLFAWDANAADWQPRSVSGNAGRGIAQALFQTKRGQQQERTYLTSYSGELLDLVESGVGSRPTSLADGTPLWNLPKGMDEFPDSTGHLDNSVWSLVGVPTAGLVAKFIEASTGTTNVFLVGFDRSSAAPGIAQLSFSGTVPINGRPGLLARHTGDPLGRLLPSGFVLATRGVRGFWFVPRSELDRIMASRPAHGKESTLDTHPGPP